jgi:phage terminase large subunit-like protein
MESGAVALEAPLSVIISTQAPTDGDLFSILLDDAQAGHDPQTIVRLYAAPPDCADPFGEEALRAANPAYDIFMNRRELLAEAAKARRLPSFSSSFKNLNLNMRVESGAPFLARDVWMACNEKPLDLHNCVVFGGLDLSSVNDLTALVLLRSDPLGGGWNVLPFFWLPEERLAERELSDHLPYGDWVDRGFIELTPGPVVSYDFVAERLYDLIGEYRIKRIAFDRWNMSHLKPCLARAGLSEQTIKEKFLEFGQGYRDMSPALRGLESAILERKIRHGGNPVLTMCVANAVVSSDPAGNRKLNRKRARGKIDGVVALAMALAAAPASWTAPFDPAALIG